MKIDKERRRHQRFGYEALVSHDVSTNDVTHTGKMFNFSKSGLYFESDQNIFPGEDIFVGLAMHADSPGKETQLIFEVKIIWYKELAQSPFRYGYGCNFLNSDESLNSFPETGQDKMIADREVLQDDFAGANDPRKQKRRPYNEVLHFSYKNKHYKQAVTNIGRGGAFILTKEKFDLGGQLTFTIHGTQSRTKLKLNGWVVRTSPDGIGVSFERRTGRERRNDLDRRTGLERRSSRRVKI